MVCLFWFAILQTCVGGCLEAVQRRPELARRHFAALNSRLSCWLFGPTHGCRCSPVVHSSSVSTAPMAETKDVIAFTEPLAFAGFESPFYTESHHKFRAKVRDFVEREVKK
jgi:hypothetical protein